MGTSDTNVRLISTKWRPWLRAALWLAIGMLIASISMTVMGPPTSLGSRGGSLGSRD
jgi:hypothetical protein